MCVRVGVYDESASVYTCASAVLDPGEGACLLGMALYCVNSHVVRFNKRVTVSVWNGCRSSEAEGGRARSGLASSNTGVF